MALGDNQLNVNGDLTFAFDQHKVSVQLSPSRAEEAVTRDKFGRPQQPLAPKTIDILVSKAEQDVKATMAGGKPIEVLEFYTLPNTLEENDEITWNAHTFRTTCVWPFGFGGLTNFVFCKAEREVDL